MKKKNTVILVLIILVLIGTGIGGFFLIQGQMSEKVYKEKMAEGRKYLSRMKYEEDVAAFAEGIVLRDETRCLPAKLEPLGPGESRITVCEGKYHQVRRMMASRGMTVGYLRREAEAGLTLAGLPLGQTRELTEAEVAALG